MKWENERRSSNVEDRRGGGGGKKLALGGGGTIVIIIIALVLGVDPEPLLDAQKQVASQQQPTAPTGETKRSPEEDKMAEFVSVVLGSTEDVWNKQFAAEKKRYQEPKLVLFTGSVSSACGYQTAAVGPFYCPADQKAYIDLEFYSDLAKKYGAPGDFAQAYVIAHEVGHHIQNLQGTSLAVHKKKKSLSEVEGNKLSVKLELQADCYAGMWAHHADKARDILEKGDVEEGLRAASAIGDDTLQKRATGRIQPESFTHGSAAQRVKWFKMGLEHGDMEKCNTFAINDL